MIAVLDLDGTLIDSSFRHHELMDKLLKGHVEAFDRADFMTYKNDGHKGLSYLVDILGLSNETASGILASWVEHIEDADYVKLDTLYLDTLPFLDKLASKGIRIVFLTARKDEGAVLSQLKALGIYDRAAAIKVVSPKDAKRQKLDYCRELMESDELIVIGDTENEKYIIDNLGVKGYLLNRGFRSRIYWDAINQKSYDSLMDIDV